MDGFFDVGPITDFLGSLDPRYRPIIEGGAVVVIVLYVVALIANPILELLHRLWRAVKWVGRRCSAYWRKVRGRPPASPPAPPPVPAIPDERTIWEQYAPLAAVTPNTNGIPIITVAAQKGGVGKTTIAAGLAMYFRKTRRKPVLVIDFDYQGSLSECFRGEAGYTDRDMTAHTLIMPHALFPRADIYWREMRRRVEDVFLYPADYPFATIENNEMIEWVQNCSGDQDDRPADDLMYRLCARLLRPEYQNKFGAVIIDSPPRLTTGAINALTASTALLVPTTLDDMSAQAARYFLEQIDRMQNPSDPHTKRSLFPALRIVGVVPSIVSVAPGKSLQVQESRALAQLKAYGKRKWNRDDFVLEEAWIPRRADIARAAGVGVAYVRSATTEEFFDRLGQAVEERLV